MTTSTHPAPRVAVVDARGVVLSANTDWLQSGLGDVGQTIDVALLASPAGAPIEVIALSDGNLMLRADPAVARLAVVEAQLDQAEELAAIGTFDWDLVNDTMRWSDHNYRIWGYSPGEVTPTVELINRHVDAEGRATLNRVLARINTGERRVEFTHRITRRDGDVRMLHATAEVMTDGAGRPLRMFGVTTDTTAQERTKERLRAHVQREAAVADIGWEALRHRDIQPLLETTVDLVRAGSCADGCAVLELEPNGDYIVRAASGLPEILGKRKLHTEARSQSTYTLQTGMTVIANDLLSERRFTPSQLVLSNGVRAAVTTTIGGTNAPYGVLTILSRQPNRFDADDGTFLQSVANVVSDAMERRRAEIALEESERAFREFFERSPAAMYRASSDGTLLAANDAFAALLGYPSADGLSLNLAGLYVDPAERDEMLAVIAREDRVTREVRWHHANGSVINVAVAWSAIRGANGEAVAWYGVAQDVTERRVTLDLLTASELRYRLLFENAIDAVAQGDGDGAVNNFNEEFTRLFGWTRADGSFRREDILVPGDPKAAEMARALATTGRYRGELEMVRRDGSRFPAEISVARYDEGFEMPRSSIVIRDISARREAEERIRVQATMLDSVQHAVVSIDASQHIIYWNRSAERLFGYTAEETVGRNVALHPLHLAEAGPQLVPAARAVAERRPWKGELTMQRKDGTRFPGLLALAPIVASDGHVSGTVGVTADLTEMRQLEAQLEQARRVSSLGHLAATVAHEFNNVLMGIQPFGEVVRMRASGDERLLAAARHIDQAVRRGKHVAQDLLRYTQQSEPILAPVRLHELLDDAAAATRDDRLRIDLDCHPALSISGDALQLAQVFTNLLVNARDAMPHGGVVRITAVPAIGSGQYSFGFVPSAERFAHIEVRDSGVGIDAPVLKHIFEPMFTTKRSGGTGLGLAIVHRIIEGHHGHVFVESQRGSGTAFHLFIPLAASVPEVEPIVRRDGQRPVGRLLLVEDDTLVAAGMAALLQDEGITADVVARGGDAVAKIAETNPSAVLLDLNLPDVSGEQVYRQIAERWPKLPVIFSTGHADEQALSEHLDQTNVTYLLKPYDFDTLMRALDRVTAGR